MSKTETASEAVKRLFLQYADELYQFIRYSSGNTNEAEDLVQDVFVEALRSWSRFRGESSEKTWLWSIARHKIIDRIRHWQQARDVACLPRPAGSWSLEATATQVDLERSLLSLSVAQRQVFILRIIQDKPAAEVAELLGWSNVKVRVTLHRALKILEKTMDVQTGSGEGGEIHGRG